MATLTRIIAPLFSLLLLSSCGHAQEDKLSLFNKGQTNFDIYVLSNSNLIETQADIFKAYIQQVSGASFSLARTRKESNQIVLGTSADLKTIDPDIASVRLKPGGFIIKSYQGNLLIAGKDEKGTVNGMYSFLEKYLGCRFYAENSIFIPKKKSFIISDISDIQNPVFEMGILGSFEGASPRYCFWHKLDLPPREDTLWLKPWIHTSTIYIKPEEFYSSHPEYFMLWNGTRSSKEINFSNDHVFEIMMHKIQAKVRKSPYIRYIGVSQADHNPRHYCMCQSCRKIMQKYGAPSAVIIEFVNKIARKFPSNTITTLAYKYSLMPPENIDLEKNVMVIVCNTEFNRTKATNFSLNNEFVKYLKKWKSITPNIMVWDYAADHAYPYTPFPNFFLIKKSIQNLHRLGINKVFIQGNTHKGYEFQELRSYLIAKLIWNPDLDVWTTINEFVKGYYGAAAPYVLKYIQTMQQKFDNYRQPLIRNAPPSNYENGFLSPSALLTYQAYIDSAKKAVGHSQVLWNRIDKLEQSLRYSKIQIFSKSAAPSRRNRVNTMAKHGASMTTREYKKLLDDFVQKAKKYNGAKITSKYKSPKKFKQAKSLK